MLGHQAENGVELAHPVPHGVALQRDPVVDMDGDLEDFPAAAHAEAVKNSLFPGAACMYLGGWDSIWRLRRELSNNQTTSLREFHDRLLSFGSVPVSLVGRSMREANGVGNAATVLANR